ncbi:MAG: 50S ribosomal protein L4 [Rickettsiales bacterium]|jgi:large subunit ribosomal protein L4|nr:50S ribosomal protein L4 [Rickettsiales bacterium]
MKVKILDLENSKISEEEINVVAESLKENHDLIASVVKWQLVNRRGVSSANTKTRGEIAATGKKPFAQKHRGAARQGSLKGAQFVGGAKAHGPKVRDFGYDLNKKIVKKALSLVVKDKVANGNFFVLDGLDKLPISTNNLAKKFETQNILKPLVVVDKTNDNFIKSVRNIKEVKLINTPKALNVYDTLNSKFLLVDKATFESLKEVL